MDADARCRFPALLGRAVLVLTLAVLLGGCNLDHVDWSRQAPREVNIENHRGYGP